MVRFATFVISLGALLSLVILGPGTAAALAPDPDVTLPVVHGTVLTILNHNGKIYIGGSFDKVGGLTRNHLAAIDAATGQVDPWAPSTDGNVLVLHAAHGLIYAGGNFDVINGTATRKSLAAFSPADGSNTGTLEVWDARLAVTTGSLAVMALASSSNRLYVGGHFDTVNGEPHRDLVALLPPSLPLPDSAWNPVLVYGDRGGNIFSLAISANRLYVGMANLYTFDTIPESKPAVLAYETANGTNTGLRDAAWQPLFSGHYNPGNPSIRIEDLEVWGGKLYVAGYFKSIDGVERSGLAALNLADGVHTAAVDPVWKPDIPFTGGAHYPFEMAIHNNLVLVGGMFDTVNGVVDREYVASFHLADGVDNGSLNQLWCPVVNSVVTAFAPYGSGLLIGGSFTTVNGQSHEGWAGFSQLLPVEISAFSAR